eukprot:352695-Chlamydomonas_euryale.AAC.7
MTACRPHRTGRRTTSVNKECPHLHKAGGGGGAKRFEKRRLCPKPSGWKGKVKEAVPCAPHQQGGRALCPTPTRRPCLVHHTNKEAVPCAPHQQGGAKGRSSEGRPRCLTQLARGRW